MIRLITLFTLISLTANSQDYWQQEVHYKIQVTLNDVDHTLSATEEFKYINNSPNALDTIYIHLWPNAYRNGETALAQQLYSNKNGVLKFGEESKKGNIDSLDFKVDGAQVKWEYDSENVDICYLVLAKPVQPGGSINVSTPFSVKIPSGSISRLGHIGESYQITQWYPKPAVYDQRGWNAMPYLNQGEFYSEYGSFEVAITLPENYVVGATGDLRTFSEQQFLDKRAEATAKSIASGTNYKEFETPKEGSNFPASSTKMKSIVYTQENVHDFAWFADKRFNVLKSEVELPGSKRKVTSWAMYTKKNADLWIKASEYLNDAIYYYSLWNGDYPYNNVTAVDGTISAGGGMEYPNVTVIGGASSAHELEVVIVHEVGHNWFYGQLGSNERVHGWMDEGMNTLNEVRYVQTKYPDNTAMSDMVLNGQFHMNDLDHHDLSDVSYRMLAALGEDQPIETHSADFTSINYGVVMYQKTGLVFFYLKDYLGEELFDKCMRAYYAEWEFKHPQPEDMRRSLEKTSGKDLSWLFDDLIQTTNHIDYKIKRVKRNETDGTLTVTVKNKGQVDGPIEVNAMIDGNAVATKWIEPGEKKSTVTLSAPNATEVRIDAGIDIPEMNRQNNIWNKDQFINRLEPIKWEFLVGDNEPDYTNVFWTPMLAGNTYDKLMVGVTVHNKGVPFNKFGYLVSPFYSFGRNFISGIAELNYDFYPTDKWNLKLSRFGLSVKSFKNDTLRNNESYYLTVSPYWEAKIGKRGDKKPYSQTLRVQSMYRQDVFGPSTLTRAGYYSEYAFTFNKPDHYFSAKLRDEYITDVNSSETMARFSAEAKYKFRYLRNKRKSWVEVRGFFGSNYVNEYNSSSNIDAYTMSLAGASGSQDLFTDEYFFGRNETTGLWSNQRMENMGGFKSTSNFGSTTGTMVAGNLYVQLPLKTGLLGAFFDAGSYDTGSGMSDVMMNTGLAIRMGDIFGIYFPLWMSEDLVTSYGSNNIFDQYGRKIRFTLKLNLINKPINLSSIL